MSNDLPPGVWGPVPNPTTEANKHVGETEDTFPIADFKSKLNPSSYALRFVIYTLEFPSTMIKSFVEGIRSPTKRRYFHEKYRRVPNIWECPMDDPICVYEAEAQFRRDKMVETRILKILEKNMHECQSNNPVIWEEKCKDFIEDYNTSRKNWTIKYGDLGKMQNARVVLNKQKNRLIEKRYKERMGMEYTDDWLLPDLPDWNFH